MLTFYEHSCRLFGGVLIFVCLQEDFTAKASKAPSASDRISGKCSRQESDMV